MKLNYYLRGLGVGIVVTALLMGIALSGRKEKMSDEEIRQRASELGMVDGNVVLSDMSENKKDEDAQKEGGEEDDKEEAPAPVSDNDISDNGNLEKDAQAGNEEQENHGEAGNQEPENDEEEAGEEDTGASREDETENPQGENVIVNEIVIITINSGDGSRVVANKLLQAGMIDDAAAFDDYLCRNGYDKRIKTGRHKIPIDAGQEEIAAAITKKGY